VPMDSAVTEDRLLGGRVQLIQPTRGYRAGIDPVLLAAAVPAMPGDRVLDLGSGAGGGAPCLPDPVDSGSVVGLEADPELVRLAIMGAERSNLGDRSLFRAGDIMEAPLVLQADSYDHVMANPPFIAMGAGRRPQDAGKAAATVESAAALDDWIRIAAVMVRQGGTVTVIHRADRLDAVLASLAGRLGALAVYPLWPDSARPAKRVIVTARKGSAAPLRLLRGLVLHIKGAFTPETEAVLRHAHGLSLADSPC
jgi:tRNA1(Val) A37 N6-methylase TrmN6